MRYIPLWIWCLQPHYLWRPASHSGSIHQLAYFGPIRHYFGGRAEINQNGLLRDMLHWRKGEAKKNTSDKKKPGSEVWGCKRCYFWTSQTAYNKYFGGDLLIRAKKVLSHARSPQTALHMRTMDEKRNGAARIEPSKTEKRPNILFRVGGRAFSSFSCPSYSYAWILKKYVYTLELCVWPRERKNTRPLLCEEGR